MKRFNFEFEDGPPNLIKFDYSPEADEEIDLSFESEIPILYANRPALLTLARLLIKMALGDYTDGFHVHLHKDFNDDEREPVIVMLHSSGTNVEAKSTGVQHDAITT